MRKINWKLHLRVLENAWVRSFAWRGDILFFRVSDIINPLAQIFIWDAVFRTRETFGSYTKETMLSYVLASTFFFALSRNWMVLNVGEDIKEGRLNQYLLKPVSYVTYTMWMGIGRTLLATLFALIIIAILITVFYQSLFIPDAAHLLLAVLVSLLAFVMNLLLSIALGFVAFWITSVEGFGNAIMLIRYFLGGTMFPLDIVSPFFVKLSFALPFAYSGYVPAQIFLGKLNILQSVHAVGVVLMWIVILTIIIKMQWRYGLKKYEGVGI